MVKNGLNKKKARKGKKRFRVFLLPGMYLSLLLLTGGCSLPFGTDPNVPEVLPNFGYSGVSRSIAIIPADAGESQSFYEYFSPKITSFSSNRTNLRSGNSYQTTFYGSVIAISIERSQGVFIFTGRFDDGESRLRVTFNPSEKTYSYMHAIKIQSPDGMGGSTTGVYYAAIPETSFDPSSAALSGFLVAMYQLDNTTAYSGGGEFHITATHSGYSVYDMHVLTGDFGEITAGSLPTNVAAIISEQDSMLSGTVWNPDNIDFNEGLSPAMCYVYSKESGEFGKLESSGGTIPYSSIQGTISYDDGSTGSYPWSLQSATAYLAFRESIQGNLPQYFD
jgi:hypothetical protein